QALSSLPESKFDSVDDSESFAEIVQMFVVDIEEPDTPWLKRLNNDVPRVNVQSLPLSYRRAKRIMDVAGALFLGIVLLPVWCVVPLLIKFTAGPGPVIFRQTRVGLNNRVLAANENPEWNGVDRRSQAAYGKHFTLYKFRTMIAEAEKDGAQFAQKNDVRVTGLGRFLRKTRIDEIPQLVNVFRGEMSLVGPRPERPEFVDKLSNEVPGYLNRLGLQPGLTGIAQIENGYDNNTESFRRKVAYDLQYLHHCSVGNDLRILFRTIHVILTGKGAL
ncbi:MAG: sugar transferase, partial [Pseudomonadota bacterium]